MARIKMDSNGLNAIVGFQNVSSNCASRGRAVTRTVMSQLDPIVLSVAGVGSSLAAATRQFEQVKQKSADYATCAKTVEYAFRETDCDLYALISPFNGIVPPQPWLPEGVAIRSTINSTDLSINSIAALSQNLRACFVSVELLYSALRLRRSSLFSVVFLDYVVPRISPAQTLLEQMHQDTQESVEKANDWLDKAWAYLNGYVINTPKTGVKGISGIIDLINGISDLDIDKPGVISYGGDLFTMLAIIEKISKDDALGVMDKSYPWIASKLAKLAGGSSFVAKYLTCWGMDFVEQMVELGSDGTERTVLEWTGVTIVAAADSFGEATVEDIAMAPAKVIQYVISGGEKTLKQRYEEVGLELSWDGVKEGIGTVGKYIWEDTTEWVSSWWPF